MSHISHSAHNGPLDLRSRRTRHQIRDAFIELLLEKDFDRITVSDLVVRAQINRATFYRHYTDIYDLAHRLTDLLFEDVLGKLPQLDPGSTRGAATMNTGAESSWALLFEHVADYADFYRAMLQPGGIPGFRARVEEVVAQQMAELLPACGVVPEETRIPAPLAIRYLAAAQVGFMQWWLENDMPFAPAQAAVHLLNLHLRGGVWALGLLPSAPSAQ